MPDVDAGQRLALFLAVMRAVQRILRDAIDLADSRRSRLVSVTLHGEDGVDDVARAVLADLGLGDVEVGFVPAPGGVRLVAVEMVHRADPLDVVSDLARRKGEP